MGKDRYQEKAGRNTPLSFTFILSRAESDSWLLHGTRRKSDSCWVVGACPGW